MLNLYKLPGNGVQEYKKQQWFFEARLNYFASEVMDMLGIVDADETDLSLYRAFQVCGTLQLPVHRHFKRVYRSDGENLIADWKISPLACYLIVINCDPIHENVAKAQLYFAIHTAANK